MRFLFVAGGLLLWLNVFVCRHELISALVCAQAELAAGNSGEPWRCLQAVFLAIAALFSVAPAWQILLGCLCFRFSIRD